MNQPAIVMLCRNSVSLSKACLPTLQAQTVHPKILIFDNASNDGTAQWAKAEVFKDHSLTQITTKEVLSVAHCWNIALTSAFWDGQRTEALVTNNDIEILPQTYAMLSGTAALDNIGMVTAVSVRTHEDMDKARDKTTLGEFRQRPHPDFSCFLIQKSAWLKIGGFDENCIGAYYEDNCAHVEMHRHGIKAVSIDLPFLHHARGTLKSADPTEMRRIEKNAAHNREYFYGKYGCYPGTKAYEALFHDEIVQHKNSNVFC